MCFTKWLNSHFAGLPQVTNLCALTHKGTILVSWNATALPVSGYMIDYTHNGNQYYWMETQYTNVTLFGKPVNVKFLMDGESLNWRLNHLHIHDDSCIMG